jgi:predicted nucleotidyltransferase component of viral defense system
MITQQQFVSICEEAYRSGVPRGYEPAILREYLQCELLSILFSLRGSERLGFIGGTALRLLWELDRFSEDLDFDNFGESVSGPCRLFEQAADQFIGRGYSAQFQLKNSGEERGGKLVVSDLLYQFGLTGHRTQNIMIKFDYTTPAYHPPIISRIMNRFGFLANIITEPLEVLAARKIHALLNRRRTQGRDLYDLVWFFSRRIKPDLATLKQEGIVSYEDLSQKLTEKVETISSDMKSYERDISAFLVNPNNAVRIGNLPQLIVQMFS